jgi:membrane protease YdiL (CAAX protease family)
LAPDGLRAIWRGLLYLVTGFLILVGGLWLGGAVVSSPATVVGQLWAELYREVALALAALLPAFLMARIERRTFDDYGLPRRAAFGRPFWTGAAWGLGAISLLLLALRGLRVLSFGHLALHGAHILRFAAFWGVFFLVVALFEEFMLRGYLLFLLTGWAGFWPAAIVLSLIFGAIHLSNSHESPTGAAGAALIGLFFCLTLKRTGNLWFAVGFHAFWDWGETFLYGVPDSGTTEPGHLLSPVLNGPAWLAGGPAGPEASVLCFALFGLLAVGFHFTHRQSRYALNRPPRPGRNQVFSGLSLRS